MDQTTRAVLKNAPKITSHARRLRIAAHRIEGDCTRLIQMAKAMPHTSAAATSADELRDQVYALCKKAKQGATFVDLAAATGATEPRIRFALSALRKGGRVTTTGNQRTMRYVAAARGRAS